MSSLDDFLGSIFSSLSHARRIADEESAAIAEYYKDNPLLSEMTVPRIRIPEVTLDIPMLIEAQEDKEPQKMRSKEDIAKDLVTNIRKNLKEEKVEFPTIFFNNYKKEILSEIEFFEKENNISTLPTREMIVRISDSTFERMIKRDNLEIEKEKKKLVKDNLRKVARHSIFDSIGKSPKLLINALTSEVKEKSSVNNTARIKVTLREEGLEWTTVQNEDGTSSNHLVSE